MTGHRLFWTVWAVSFLAFGLLVIVPGVALSANCSICERNFADCRMPAQPKFVACMNEQKTECGGKCTNDCKNQKNIQQCQIECARSCQGTASCRTVFRSAINACENTFSECKKGCTR